MALTRFWGRFRKHALFGILLPAAGYLTFHFIMLARVPPSPLEELGIDPATINADTLSPRLAKRLGVRTNRAATEIVTVVISATFCVANRVEGFHEAARAIPDLLNAQVADRPHVVTRTVGIALDHDPRAGTEYLFKLARFDEVIAGGSWLNTATEKFLFGTYRWAAEIPQVVILERTVTWSENFASLEGERVLTTIVGADSIMAWVKRGAPVSTLSARAPDEQSYSPKASVDLGNAGYGTSRLSTFRNSPSALDTLPGFLSSDGLTRR